ncbi:pheromone-binding protein Gp-9 [Solenopsis invicta]
MKHLVLCACVLIFALSNATEIQQEIQNEIKLRLDLEACLIENGLNNSGLYSMNEVSINVHTKPGNEERTRKNGCFMACVLKKQNLMEGTNIKEDEVIARLYELTRQDLKVILGKIVRKCLEEKRDITQECAKCFSIFECIIQTMDKFPREHEHEEIVTTE